MDRAPARRRRRGGVSSPSVFRAPYGARGRARHRRDRELALDVPELQRVGHRHLRLHAVEIRAGHRRRRAADGGDAQDGRARDHDPRLGADRLGADRLSPPSFVMYVYSDTNGVPGLVLQVIGMLVLVFILLGRLMEITGAIKFFTDIALSSMGHRRGGPAKVAVVASSIFGSI